jgi:hypothetical protein
MAIKTVKEIQTIDSKPAKWISTGVIQELESEVVQKRLQRKNFLLTLK